MKLTVNYWDSTLPLSTLDGALKYCALRTVVNYPFSITEKKLDRYCRKKYGGGIRAICFDLVQNCKITKVGQTLIVSFDQSADSIARLITYGNLEVYGSRILKDAFM